MLTLLSFLLFSLLTTNVDGVCNRPRIRKSWDSMTRTERTIYVEAVERGMDAGYHMMFAEIHSEMVSEQEAHGTCGFLLWHRRFLLAYENMLRSFGTRYECVTIPYWNYFADYAKYQTNRCSNMEQCSRILRGLGGSRGASQWVYINGEWVWGKCNARRPNNHFCESSSVSGNDCAKCIPRGDWRNQRFPSGLGYASLVETIQSSTNYQSASYNLQDGPHNGIHNAAGAAMTTYVSPADIVFFSHHATIDMLHHLYYECHVGASMSDNQKRTSNMAFGRCDGLSSTSSVQMHWKLAGWRTSTEAHRDEILRPFFANVGQQYYQFVDSLDMGPHSYGYQMDHLVRNLVRNGLTCPAGDPSRRSSRRLQEQNAAHDVYTDDKHDMEQYAAEKECTQWYENTFKLARKTCSSDKETVEQLELMECAYHEAELGGVEDYSDAFRKSFKVKGHTRCKQLLMDMESGNKTIHLNKWKDTFAQHHNTIKDISEPTHQAC